MSGRRSPMTAAKDNDDEEFFRDGFPLFVVVDGSRKTDRSLTSKLPTTSDDARHGDEAIASQSSSSPVSLGLARFVVVIVVVEARESR